MKHVRRCLLGLVVALLAIQASAFAVPAARESLSPDAGGGCGCCRTGSGATCMCHRAGASSHCGCSMRSVERRELPWLLGITGAPPVMIIALAAPALAAPLLPIVESARSLRSEPPTPPPRA